MRTRETDVEPFVNLSELTEIELLILRRMREYTVGEHRSLFHGTGFDYVGLRDWQSGDRMSQIDWAQSSLTNFSPMIVRDFEQPSTATVIAVADGSLSTRCGIDGVPIAAAIARSHRHHRHVGGLFQDLFGLITFDARFDELAAIRPRIGKNQVIHCLEAYQFQKGLQPLKRTGSLSMSLAGVMRKTSMVPVISDFLFDSPGEILSELRAAQLRPRRLHRPHRQRALPSTCRRSRPGGSRRSTSKPGEARVMSRGSLKKLSARTRGGRTIVTRQAKAAGMDVLQIGVNEQQTAIAMSEFIAERRLRKV